jgi:hypothetical protein
VHLFNECAWKESKEAISSKQSIESLDDKLGSAWRPLSDRSLDLKRKVSTNETNVFIK